MIIRLSFPVCKWVTAAACLLALACANFCTFAESLSIVEVPSKLPRNARFGNYSPPLEFQYSGLRAGQNYTLKGWLLNPGPWGCASTQWCEHQIPIDNLRGTNATGMIVLADNMDVFDYATFDWVIRLYDASGNEVAFTERYINATANLPPTLDAIGSHSGAVGEDISFTVTASDPDGGHLSFGAESLPPGANFDAQTGKFSWVPSSGGSYSTLFYAQDDGDAHLKDAELVDFSIQGPSPVVIIKPPQSKTIARGEPVRFAVVAQGEPPLGYQWRHAGSDGFVQTNSSFVLTSVTSADEGEYSVVVTNKFSTETSAPAFLTVTNVPPVLEFTHVSPFGSSENLQGQVKVHRPGVLRSRRVHFRAWSGLVLQADLRSNV